MIQSTQKYFLTISLLFILLIVVFILWIVHFNYPPYSPPHSQLVTVDDEDNDAAPVPDPIDQAKTAIPKQSTIHSTTPPLIANSSSPSLSKTRVQFQDEPLSIQIVDAMGDEIPKGCIHFQDQDYNFVNGSLQIDAHPASGACPLACEANGYASATEIIHLPVRDSVMITLEYLCSFDTKVYLGNESNRPVAGAEVTLWKGPNVQRPLPANTKFNYLTQGLKRMQAHLKREEDGCRIIHPGENAPPVRGAFLGKQTDLEMEDLIVGISGCRWNENVRILHHPLDEIYPYNNHNSLRLRVWDALIAYSYDEKDNLETIRRWEDADDFVDIQRGASKFYCMVDANIEKGTIVSTQTTNSNGTCRFESLPAGTYIAQARKGNIRSFYKILHPARSGADLNLISASSKVRVRVVRAGVEYKFAAAIPGASIQFHPIDQTQEGFYVGETNRYGSVDFNSLPWGKYKLRITPSSDLFETPKTMLVDIDEPQEYLIIELKGEGYTISGRVLVDETNESVADFGLELSQRKPNDGTFSRLKSDSNGAFTFKNVPSGEYCLSPLIDRRYHIGYTVARQMEKLTYPLSAVSEFNLSTISENDEQYVFSSLTQDVAGLTLFVTDDIHDIKYYVHPTVETLFRGSVRTEDGKPVPGASISTDSAVRFLSPDPVSDQDGRFELTTVTRPSRYPHQLTFVASVKEILEGPMTGMSHRVLMRGIKDVLFSIGDDVSGIDIVVEDIIRDGKITGKIETEDGLNYFDGFNAMAIQKSNSVMERIGFDGEYIIEGLESGPVTLWILPPAGFEQDRRFGEVRIQEYCSEFYDIEIPEDGEPPFIHTTLVRAAHLAGCVVNAIRQPVVMAALVLPEVSQSSKRSTYSDDRGMFWMYALRPGKPYRLEITCEGRTKPDLILEGVIPPNDDMTIVLQEGSTQELKSIASDQLILEKVSNSSPYRVEY